MRLANTDSLMVLTMIKTLTTARIAKNHVKIIITPLLKFSMVTERLCMSRKFRTPSIWLIWYSISATLSLEV